MPTTLLTIQAGAGGLDAEEFAATLTRMYCRYAKRRQWTVTVVETAENRNNGIRRAVLLIAGTKTDSKLKDESGIHRLIRQSPFNQAKKRQTAFVSVTANEAPATIERNPLPPSSLRIDTYRSSGPGGQHANKTETAVRITHTPTGLTASAQSQRSQSANRKLALQVLTTRVRTTEADLAKPEAERTAASFARQRRTYTMHPYQQVRDNVSQVKTSRVQDVLDGNLDLVG